MRFCLGNSCNYYSGLALERLESLWAFLHGYCASSKNQPSTRHCHLVSLPLTSGSAEENILKKIFSSELAMCLVAESLLYTSPQFLGFSQILLVAVQTSYHDAKTLFHRRFKGNQGILQFLFVVTTCILIDWLISDYFSASTAAKQSEEGQHASWIMASINQLGRGLIWGQGQQRLWWLGFKLLGGIQEWKE